jgi:hypothetical protein
MAGLTKHFDSGSVLVILITGLLFLLALQFKGFTHDMLLEAGVLMISIKLILMAYKNSVSMHSIAEQLHEIRTILERLDSRGVPNTTPQQH